jgi:hypothetical protein
MQCTGLLIRLHKGEQIKNKTNLFAFGKRSRALLLAVVAGLFLFILFYFFYLFILLLFFSLCFVLTQPEAFSGVAFLAFESYHPFVKYLYYVYIPCRTCPCPGTSTSPTRAAASTSCSVVSVL